MARHSAQTFLSLALASALALAAGSAAAQTTDGTCVTSPEPALSGLSALLGQIAALPTPIPPMSEMELANRDANAAKAFPLTDFERAVIRDHATLTVPGSYQSDGTCLFHALRMVSMHWRSIGHDVTAIPVDDRSAFATGDAIAYARDVLGKKDARQSGINFEQARKIGEHYGFAVDVRSGASMHDLLDAVRNGTPPIVKFYCCENGKPSTEVTRLADGTIAPFFHAGVIEGIDENRGLVIIKHAWNRKQPFVVPIAEFEKSWKLANREMLVMTLGGTP